MTLPLPDNASAADVRALALTLAVQTWATREPATNMPAEAVLLAAEKYEAYLDSGTMPES